MITTNSFVVNCSNCGKELHGADLDQHRVNGLCLDCATEAGSNWENEGGK